MEIGSHKVGQVSALPGLGLSSASATIDNISANLYNALAADPIVGPLAKLLPPPPKISEFFTGQVAGQYTPLYRFTPGRGNFS